MNDHDHRSEAERPPVALRAENPLDAALAARAQRARVTPLLDAKDAGALLAVPPSWLLAQARRNAVPHVRLGKYVRFDEADLHRWVESTKRGPK